MAGGRPTKYKKEYCEDLIEHMAQGFSFHSFGGKLLVSARVLFDWLDRHPEFQEAKAVGEYACMYFWEKTGIAGTHGKIKGFQQASFIFNMKARFAKYGWRDIPEDPDKLKSSDRTELAKRLIETLSSTLKDNNPCQDLNPSHQSSPALSSLGLLGESNPRK
jgi:hypothetical protein